MSDEQKVTITGIPEGHKIYFSRLSPPEEFPNVRTIWLGHPAIARFVARVLNWWASKRTSHEVEPVRAGMLGAESEVQRKPSAGTEKTEKDNAGKTD